MECERTGSDLIETRNRRERGGVDVLKIMVVTLAVFHFETSALNATAFSNTVRSMPMPFD